MIRTLSRRVFVPNHSIILVNSIQRRPMATKLQLKTEPGDFVQSRIKTFTENLTSVGTNFKQDIIKKDSAVCASTEPPMDYRKYAEEKLRAFVVVAKSVFFITCERAVVVARSKEMKDALDQTLITLQYYFVLMRRITEEIIVIVQRVMQRFRKKPTAADKDATDAKDTTGSSSSDNNKTSSTF